jgi:hypothetical protein
MGWRDWFRSRPPDEPDPDTVVDPVFGPVVPDDEGIWVRKGVEFLPGLPPVSVSVPGDDSGPSATAREAYLELRRRYPELTASVAEKLFDRSNAGYRRYGVVDAAGLWPHARLRRVSVFATGSGFELGYDLPWGGGHSYDVVIEGWRAVSVACNG